MSSSDVELLRHKVAILEESLSRLQTQTTLANAAATSASSSATAAAASNFEEINFQLRDGEDDDLSLESYSIEGFRLLWSHWLEVNSWVKAFSLWEIMLLTLSTEDMQLWMPPGGRMTGCSVGTDPMGGNGALRKYRHGGFRSLVMYRFGCELVVSQLNVLVLATTCAHVTHHPLYCTVLCPLPALMMTPPAHRAIQVDLRGAQGVRSQERRHFSAHHQDHGWQVSSKVEQCGIALRAHC